MIAEAETYIQRIPSNAVGSLFLEEGRPVQPDPDHLERYERRNGAISGIWPSSPEIFKAMLDDHYRRG
jgi:hypothetical protein